MIIVPAVPAAVDLSGIFPYGVAFNPAGTKAYIAANGAKAVVVVDVATDTVTKSVLVANNPFDVAFAPNNSKAYVTTDVASQMYVFNPSTDAISKTVTTTTSRKLSFSADSAKAYVGSYGSGGAGSNVTVFDSTDALVATIPFTSAYGTVVTGTKCYAIGFSPAAVAVIDTATNTVTKTISLGSNGRSIAVNPAGTKVYAGYTSGIAVIDTATDTVTKTIPGTAPAVGIAFNSAGTKAYARGDYNVLRVIDTATETVSKSITIGPDGTYAFYGSVAVCGTKVYVTNPDAGTFTVIDPATDTVTKTVPVRLAALRAAVDNHTNQPRRRKK